MIVVTAAIIFNKEKDKFLISQRLEHSHNGLLWEFPGGKVEKFEKPTDCIVREIKEELNLNIEVEDIFEVTYHRYVEKEILLLIYKCNYVSGKLEFLVCNNAKWISINEVDNYQFAEADIPSVKKLIKRIK